MREIALHLLDVAENSVNAQASRVDLEVCEDTLANRLRLTVIDNGHGMDEITAARAVDPFVTSRTKRRMGLGLPLLKENADLCNGRLVLSSRPACGTRLEAEFELNHIDRPPLGDLASTFLTLEVGYPKVHWIFAYEVDGRRFEFDDAELKQKIGDNVLSEPEVLTYLRSTFATGLANVQAGLRQPVSPALGV